MERCLFAGLILFCFLFRVPNIKFNVAKVLQSLIPIVDQSVSIYLNLKFLASLLLNTFAIHLWFHVAWKLFWCRLWRRQFVPLWLSLVRTQMLMSDFLLPRHFKQLIMLWCQASQVSLHTSCSRVMVKRIITISADQSSYISLLELLSVLVLCA